MIGALSLFIEGEPSSPIALKPSAQRDNPDSLRLRIGRRELRAATPVTGNGSCSEWRPRRPDDGQNRRRAGGRPSVAMMESRGRGTLFHIGGVPIRIHFTWLFVAAYLSVVFAGQFHRLARGAEIEDVRVLLPPWVWGVLMTMTLFACVVLHELAHVAVARRGGARVRAITLMMLGGVSEIGEVDRPRLELRMAVAGPIVSLIVAAVFYGLFRVSRHGPPDLQFGLFYLAEINLIRVQIPNCMIRRPSAWPHAIESVSA
jgi:hypothetical protein